MTQVTGSIPSSSSLVETLSQDWWENVFNRVEYPDFARFFSTAKSIQPLREKNGNAFERYIFFLEVPIFDRNKWQVYWNAVITDKYDANKIEIRTLRAFLACYWGPIPKELGIGKVKDHCLIPTVVPVEETVNGTVSKHCLDGVEELAKQPTKGHAAKYSLRNEALKQHGKTGAEEDSLVIYLKGVVARGESWENQVLFLEKLNADGYECEIKPGALPQITNTFAHHVVTGELPFGDNYGMEKQCTSGRTREKVHLEGSEKTNHIIAGCFSAGQVLDPLGDSAPAVLHVLARDYDNQNYGVVVYRKF
jgi:hypothetical protein